MQIINVNYIPGIHTFGDLAHFNPVAAVSIEKTISYGLCHGMTYLLY